MGMTDFSLTGEREGATTVLTVTGELDLATVGQLRQLAVDELDAPQCTTLVLDVAGLTFLDSTAVGCWVAIRNHAQESGCEFLLRSVPAKVDRVLEIGGLTELFPRTP